MTTIGNTSRPAYVYDAETDTWIPIGIGSHTHEEYIEKTIIAAKGDIIVGSAADVVTRLQAGNNGHVLSANSSAPLGVEWAPPTSVSVTSPITNSGTSTAPNLGLGTIATSNLPAGPADGTVASAAFGFGYLGLPQSTTAGTTGSYTIQAADAGEHIYASATRTVTIPSNATLALPIGTTIVFIAGTGATMTIAITSDTMFLAGPGTTGTRTLSPFGIATAVKITLNSWIISGNGLS
jgi:hypothetical protein